MRFALAFLALAIACNPSPPQTQPPPVFSRDTLLVTDTLRVTDTVEVAATDTVRDTVTVRIVETLAAVVTPAPLADSIYTVREVRVKPDSVKVEAGDSVQFCPYLVFKAGQWARPAEYASVPGCADALHFTANAITRWRKPNVVQQFITDRTCFKWAATGGTITAQTGNCDAP